MIIGFSFCFECAILTFSFSQFSKQKVKLSTGYFPEDKPKHSNLDRQNAHTNSIKQIEGVNTYAYPCKPCAEERPALPSDETGEESFVMEKERRG